MLPMAENWGNPPARKGRKAMPCSNREEQSAQSGTRNEQIQFLTPENIKKYRLKVLVTVVNRNQYQKITELICKHNLFFNYLVLGEGTASSEILDLLGLGGVDKALIVTIVPQFLLGELLENLKSGLHLRKAGAGIAFTLPISGVSSSVIKLLDKGLEAKRESFLKFEQVLEEGIRVHEGYSNFLVVAVVNQGCSEELMATAKKAGARGGTVIHARRARTEEISSFFGIPVQAEKEIVAIIIDKEHKKELMAAIGAQFGLATDAGGIIFSVPVDETVGIAE